VSPTGSSSPGLIRSVAVAYVLGTATSLYVSYISTGASFVCCQPVGLNIDWWPGSSMQFLQPRSDLFPPVLILHATRRGTTSIIVARIPPDHVHGKHSISRRCSRGETGDQTCGLLAGFFFFFLKTYSSGDGCCCGSVTPEESSKARGIRTRSPRE